MKNEYKAKGEPYGYFTSLLIKTVVIFLFALLLSKLSSGQTAMAKLSIQLLINTNAGSVNTADACMVLYSNNFSAGLGPEDSYKFQNLDENLAIPCGIKLLSVEGKPTIAGNDTVALKIWRYRHNNYFLKFDGSNFSPLLTAVLKDNYLHTDKVISLSGVTLLNFSLTADTLSSSSDRFCVVFKPAGSLPLNMLSFSATQKDKSISVDWKVTNESTGSIYEIEKSTNGVSFFKQTTILASNQMGGISSYQWTDKNIENGNNYYRVKLIEKSGKTEYSKIVKVTANSTNHDISIFPNPVKGNNIGLHLMDIDKGIYQVKLYNTKGQQVYTTTFAFEGGNGTQTIRVQNNLEKGKYVLQMSSASKNFSKSVLID